MTPVLQISYSLVTIKNAVEQFWQYAHHYRVLAFSGELGAGKTTFVHTLCEYLGVTDAVSSPTFALINEYHFQANAMDNKIYHMDWYRVKDTDEAINAGMEDALLSDAYCFVEWPEQAIELFPLPYLWISIETLEDNKRSMTVNLVSH
ncbi:tRNA (adenosine(37)-N6)-threonylcarbamoyltransferase complex ATPase subunit type 1 TsaE [Taibaiella soli]|uniref:tRNA threonylcarbamoyladenosine biosynthesis protein TsaE n=1 Tax=Taibaiella soli TaxID=1649169 RepID=A0A2W2BNP2_9BACT|nr:tRNA (adenosine(37)-N6)-threonylcarbamoyltransferase complex ATPase subunit type 1 TsaE [Taibaiella soli]PZF75026.1 tRNA (adenosine(37)-N6)-threonylcarbamoyltransferase complex ATPase subunit type 1 TsaE [Taibaiella soli]